MSKRPKESDAERRKRVEHLSRQFQKYLEEETAEHPATPPPISN